MPMVIPRNGEADVLQYFVNKLASQDLSLQLFISNTVPAETDTAATYSPATFTGYAAKTLTGATWNDPVEGSPTTISYPEQTYTSTADQAAQNVYGYFATRVTSGRIAFAERFPSAPYIIEFNGDNIKLTPVITGA